MRTQEERKQVNHIVYCMINILEDGWDGTDLLADSAEEIENIYSSVPDELKLYVYNMFAYWIGLRNYSSTDSLVVLEDNS